MSVMIESGLDIGKVITHRLHFTDYQEGFDLMNSGKAGKIILNWD
jgi:threonine 3-dehydrogenase